MEVRTAVASATLSSGGVGWQAEKAHRPAHEDLRQRWVVEPLGLVLHDPEERGAQRMDDHQREELRIAPAMDLGVGPQVHRGEPALNPIIARKLLQEVAHPADLQPSVEVLTAREATVLRLIAQGLSNQAIGDELAVSEATVRTHVSRILSKLHLASRTQAALYAVREGLSSEDEASPEAE